MNKNIETSLKENYVFKELSEGEILKDPLPQFEKWFNEALAKNIYHANAMFLATCSSDGKPSVRTVLLKDFDERGFVFFTNYESRKGNDLNENPNASILFFWKEMERQVRIDGVCEKVTKDESEAYFHIRPFESQIAALASDQSRVIESRDIIEKKFDELKKKYEDIEVPLPDYWGGYRLIPDKMEFWQGRQNRMHDRILYTQQNGEWKIERLAP